VSPFQVLVDIFQGLGIILRGWVHLTKIFMERILHFFETKSYPEKLFFTALLIQVLTSGLGWIQYRITFNQEIETVNISIRWNVIFVMGSLLNFFFTGFWRSSWVWLFFICSQSILLISFGIATLIPAVAFTDILKVSDYNYSVFFYAFGSSLLIAWAIGFAIYRAEGIKLKKLPTL